MSDHDEFFGEAITPVMMEGVDPGRMAAGEPALPGAFRWRGGSFTIAGVTRRWKEHGPCRHGSGEAYLRKHWFEVVIGDGRTMKIYFERQPGSGRRAAAGSRGGGRWRLFSISGGQEPGAAPEGSGRAPCG